MDRNFCVVGFRFLAWLVPATPLFVVDLVPADSGEVWWGVIDVVSSALSFLPLPFFTLIPALLCATRKVATNLRAGPLFFYYNDRRLLTFVYWITAFYWVRIFLPIEFRDQHLLGFHFFFFIKSTGWWYFFKKTQLNSFVTGWTEFSRLFMNFLDFFFHSRVAVHAYWRHFRVFMDVRSDALTRLDARKKSITTGTQSKHVPFRQRPLPFFCNRVKLDSHQVWVEHNWWIYGWSTGFYWIWWGLGAS